MSRYGLLFILLILQAEGVVTGRIHAPVEEENIHRSSEKPDTLRGIVLDTLPIYDSCHRARPICLDSVYSFVTPTGFPFAYLSWYQCCEGDTLTSCCVNYGCLVQAPQVCARPHWFYAKISTAGSLIFKANTQPRILLGMVIYGPYSAPTSACIEGLTSDKIVDCYNPFYTTNFQYAVCTIPNALPNEYYLIRISGVDHDVLQFHLFFHQENYGQPGAGTTTCDFVTHCSILEITHQANTCNPLTNTFSVSGQIYFSNPPSTGYLVVWDSLTGYSTTIPPPFQSPASFTLEGLPCDHLLHPIYASFWDSAGCETHTYVQAPVLCPDATINGGGNICDDGVSEAQIQILFTPNAAPPYTFAWRVNGVAQVPVTSAGPFPYVLNTKIPGIYTMDTSYNSYCAGTLSGEAVVNLLPLPQPHLGPDITACEGRGVMLNPGTGFSKYLWNTGDTTPSIEVDKSGTYWVEVTSSNGCTNSELYYCEFYSQTHPCKH